MAHKYFTASSLFNLLSTYSRNRNLVFKKMLTLNGGISAIFKANLKKPPLHAGRFSKRIKGIKRIKGTDGVLPGCLSFTKCIELGFGVNHEKYTREYVSL